MPSAKKKGKLMTQKQNHDKEEYNQNLSDPGELARELVSA
jgi:hypothetical protein